MKQYLTASEAAEALGLTYPTLLSRIRRGKIKAEKFGYALAIHRDEIKRIQGEQKNARSTRMAKRTR